MTDSDWTETRIEPLTVVVGDPSKWTAEQREECAAASRDLYAMRGSVYDPDPDPRAVIERVAAAFRVLGGW